jgi:uncharacterized membrane protein
MRRYLIAYIAVLLVMLVLDGTWLTLMVRSFYRPRLGELLLEKPNLVPAVAFYLLYGAGVVALAVGPALRGETWTVAAVSGAILGFVAYATYDLTNHATLRDWSSAVTVVDMAWGTFLTGTASAAAYWAATRFG